MAAFTKFESFVLAVGTGLLNLNTNVLKVCLTNTEPDVTSDTKLADITVIAGVDNGYAAQSVGSTSYTQTGGVAVLVGADVTFTQAGANPIGPFQWAVLYSHTATDKDLIGMWDHGTPVTLIDGETFTLDFDPDDGILDIQ